MAVGTVQTLVVCVPANGGQTQSPCPDGQSLATVQGYLLDPAQAASIQAQNAPFDYAFAAGVWGFVFTFVVALYLVSKSAGTVLAFLRK